VPFLEEEEDVELPNSCVNFIEIPLTLGFECQMFHAKDVESTNSCVVVEVSLNEILLISSVNSLVLRLHTMEVSPFHVIFNLNEVLIATRFDKGYRTIFFHPILKEFLKKFLVQFQVYIWCKTQISIHVSKVLD
jgi:hypothetical protein